MVLEGGGGFASCILSVWFGDGGGKIKDIEKEIGHIPDITYSRDYHVKTMTKIGSLINICYNSILLNKARAYLEKI